MLAQILTSLFLSHSFAATATIDFVARTNVPGVSVEGKSENFNVSYNAQKLTGSSFQLDVFDMKRGMDKRDQHLREKVFKAENRAAPVSIPAKVKYMRRDVIRKSEKRGYPYKWPDTFPTFALIPARIGTVIHGEAWEAEFIKGVYELYFEQGQDISGKDLEPIQQLLSRLGASADAIFAKLEQDEFKDALKHNTDKAIEMGIFGAPMFIANGEMFWGDDTLDEAIEHLLSNHA